MANIVKQVAIYKDNNWSTKDIGVDVDKVFLKNKTLGAETGFSLDQFLNYFPSGRFSQGFIAADETGKLMSTSNSPAEISDLKTSVNTLKEKVQEKTDSWVNELISNQFQSYTPVVGSSFYDTVSNIVRDELLKNNYGPIATDDTVILSEFLKMFSNTLFPKGAIHINTTGTNPKVYLGGDWKRISNTFLIDIDEEAQNYVPLGPGKVTVNPVVTATSSTITIPKHNYTPSGQIQSNTMPAYEETVNQGTSTSSIFSNRLVVTKEASKPINYTFIGASQDLNHDSVTPVITVKTEAINIIPPYKKVYIWQRTDEVGPQDMYVISGQNWNTQDFLLSRETIDKWNEIKNYSPTEGEV